MKAPITRLLLSLTLLLVLFPLAILAADSIATLNGKLSIQPIQHATFAIRWGGKLMVVDPVGPVKQFQPLGAPDLILLTDIHGDHLSKETLEALARPQTKLVAPPSVVEQLPGNLKERTTTLGNGAKQQVDEIGIEAIPAYNVTPDRQKFHAKGRGNGYVLTLGEKRVYISGDTEPVPEMLGLRDIDVAFVCMNLPYTMTVEQAADAVRVFKPKIVYPYHYRGSDLEKFKQLLSSEPGIDVRIRDWYPRQK